MKSARFSIFTILLLTAMVAIACAIIRHLSSLDPMSFAFGMMGLIVVTVFGTGLLPLAIIAASFSPRKDPQGVAVPNRIVSFLLGLLVADVAVLFLAILAAVHLFLWRSC
jgi:hypothetical protein